MAVPRRFALRAAAKLLLGFIPGVVAFDLWVGWLDRDQGSDEGSWLIDEQLGWAPRPYFENPELETKLDRFGLRNAEIPADAPPDEIRILGLGASRIYGARNVRQSQTWSYWLEQMLAGSTTPPARVLNGGVMAYSLAQAARRGIRLLDEERDGVRVDPNLVLIALSPGAQTLIDNSSARRWVRVGEKLVEEDVIEGWPEVLVPARVALHRALMNSNLYVRHRAKLDLDGDDRPQEIQSWMLSRQEAAPALAQRIERAFDELQQLHLACQARGIRLVALLMPDSEQDSDARWSHYTRNFAQFGAPPSTTPRLEGVEVMGERCRELGIEAWDLSVPISTMAEDRKRWYADDGLHWSGEGHRLIARAIYEHLLGDGWLQRLAQAGAQD
ncbi:alginate O-acetyltransferase AlgX-related protein [Engelhardtia mirabilis]|uniref:AlgX/AlgJ SGNH hydrolase-like domain-containing protein n=1 Tax=Engelhardtia mirabilis TaxID=2528011 RepID=A0A518BNC7_9BACT|nr:hypothetical protein Pla133_35400 [Planctomycetes bacterium Pla133]QDV02768.1 hypothetical protein Pla86_35380 [Planctomycetes bacterium Pla86]